MIAVLNFGASQKIASLNIQDGAIVTLDNALPFAAASDNGLSDSGDPSFGASSSDPVQVVPEPGSITLLLIGMLGIAGRRRRRDCV